MNLPINEIVCGDCLEVMKDWPDNCVDLVLTDPPYGIGIAKWDKEVPVLWLGEAERILLDSGALYCFGDSLTISKIQWHGEKVIEMQWKCRCVWVYEDGPRNYRTWTSKHEDCLVFHACNHIQTTPTEPSIHKDPRWGDDRHIGDVWKCNRVLNNYKERDLHITQKPIDLMIMVIEASSKKGDLILDPFCGSGTTCVAAKMLGRNYIGIDISEEYCEIAQQRIKAVETGVPVKEQRKGQLGLFE